MKRILQTFPPGEGSTGHMLAVKAEHLYSCMATCTYIKVNQIQKTRARHGSGSAIV